MKYTKCGRTRFTFNPYKDFSIGISVVSQDPKDKRNLTNLWKKEGFINQAKYEEVKNGYLYMETYHYDEKGCWGRYNPTVKGTKINFEHLYAPTVANVIKLVNEAKELYKQGRTA